ncbi:MAG: hypothetical protein ABIP39_14475, partial [Polyangiaceae bacterium]
MLTVVVLIAQSPSDEGHSVDEALKKAAHDTLGAETQIDLRDVAELPDDAAAESLGRAVDAGALVEIAWRDGTRRTATIRLRLGTAPWQSREIGFASSDADAEEGRTLGFAIASMIPEQTAPPPSPPPPPPALRTPSSPPIAEERPLPREPRHYIGALEITGVAAHAIGGYGGGAGGAAAIQLYLSPHFAFRAGGGARAGEVGPAAATLETFIVSSGLAWRSENATHARPFGVAIRTDFLVAHESVNHLDTDDPHPVR